MRAQAPSRTFVALVALLFACSGGGPKNATRASGQGVFAASAPAIRFSEIHYDNAGADVGEAIEISGPAGADVTGWSVVLYNGNGGAAYNTQTLSGAIPATCGARGVLVVSYPANGIQNGGTTATGTSDPDGVALVDAGGALVEFLSYEGSLTATGGPATGVASTDIGVRELGSEAAGLSLQRAAGGAWSGPIANTFGACNDNDAPPPVEVASVSLAPASATIAVGATLVFVATALDAAGQPMSGVSFAWASSDATIAGVDGGGVATGLAPGDVQITATAVNGVSGAATLHVSAPPPPPPPTDVRVNEIHYDNTGTDVGEAVEIAGPIGADLSGWSIVLYDGNGGLVYGTQALSGVLPATCADAGVMVVSYPQNGLQNGSPDGLALVDAAGHVVEFLSYEGSFSAADGPAAGMTSTDIGASEPSSTPIGQSLQRSVTGQWSLAASTFGACNGSGTPPPPPGNTISFSGRLASDPPLPVGFQDQLFATVRDAGGATVPTSIAWSSETPDIASIDASGVMTALAAGTATLRATAADGVTTATYSLPTRVAIASVTARYDGNAEFGEPADADPSDDFIVRHREFVASYNPSRGTPNWVSYDLDASAFGAEDRCDCFTFDPDLPARFARYTTADYTGAAAIAGYGIDRGHLTRSFDRTAGSLDNAMSFLFSNVVPQASDLNQGPWAALENDLGDLARNQNKEVYIIAGVVGSKGTLKNEGKIVIPASTWKVAVIMPRDHGLADVVDYRDLEVIAVNMPNDPGVRNVPWQTYLTTVDEIEALSGYDLLALLPDKIENIVEAGIAPPIAALNGPYAANEGDAITFDASASLDTNGSVARYAWDFGDGVSAGGAVVTHVYAQDGAYDVRLTVTDNDGLSDTALSAATVSNVPPSITAFAVQPASGAYVASGGFSDPGADAWTATVDWGDGVVSGGALVGHDFSFSHVYARGGAFTVTVTIADDDAQASAAQAVIVPDPAPTVQDAIAMIDALVAAGKLGRAIGEVFKCQLRLAQAAPGVAGVAVRVVIGELDLVVRLGGVAAGDVAALRAVLVRLG